MLPSLERRQRKIFADTDPDNAASNTLLALLGFQREGFAARELRYVARPLRLAIRSLHHARRMRG